MSSPIIANGSALSTRDISWDQFVDGDLPPTLPRRLIQAIHEATAAAKAALPALHERLDRARDLVLAGAVSLNDDGSFTVTSQSRRGTSYRVDSACPCQGAVQEPRCKHLLATWLWRKAQAAAAAAEEGTPPDALRTEARPPALSPPLLPQAPASVTVDLHIRGRLARLTLRDHDDTGLLTRLEAVLQRFPLAEDRSQATPVTLTTTASPNEATTLPAAEGWCPVHGCAMTRHTNAKGSWWSHKRADGTWCRGKTTA